MTAEPVVDRDEEEDVRDQEEGCCESHAGVVPVEEMLDCPAVEAETDEAERQDGEDDIDSYECWALVTRHGDGSVAGRWCRHGDRSVSGMAEQMTRVGRRKKEGLMGFRGIQIDLPFHDQLHDIQGW